MSTKLNKTLKQYAAFSTWVEQLKGSAADLWLEPIANGKWSIREILVHLMQWDRNSLNMMVPNMIEGAQLFFVDIQKHNTEAAKLAQSYTSLDELIDDVIHMREQLIECLKRQYDDKAKFTIDNSNYSFNKFVHDLISHDEHHQKQIDTFLEEQRRG